MSRAIFVPTLLLVTVSHMAATQTVTAQSGTAQTDTAQSDTAQSVSAQRSVAGHEPPLHRQIDALLSESPGPKAVLADDATFARRASLDLIGRIPTRDELVEFVDSTDEDKRSRLIDRLLASDEYADHMAVLFDVMFMERRANQHVKSDEFRGYLRGAIAANRSYREIVAEILSADGSESNVRSAAAFYLEREVEPHLLTRDVGRVFFGVDLQCAQCHDHPLIDDYYQADYYGLNAFFVRSSLFQPDKKKPALIAESATGEADFKSVFTEREGRLGPRIPGGTEMLEVSLKPTEQYEVAPSKNVRPVPKFSRREQLAKSLVENTPLQFDQNIANRLWAHLFGRGLVHPVDLLHSDNPPTHPALLDLLANHFAASGYNIKLFVREIMLTEAYQRDFRLPPLEVEISAAAEQIANAREVAKEANTRLTEAQEKLDLAMTTLDAAMAATKPFRDAESKANKAVADAVKNRDAAAAKVSKTEASRAEQKKAADLLAASVSTTKAAAEALKDDKELADALATIQKRVAAQLEVVKKTDAALKSEREGLAASEQVFKTASAQADKAIADRVTPEKLVIDRRAEMFAARKIVQELRLDASVAHEQVVYWEALLEFDRLTNEETRLLATVDQTQTRLGLQQTATKAAAAKAAAADEIRAASEKKVAAATQAKKEADAAFALAQDVASTLKDSIAKADAVRTKVEADDTLTQAIELLEMSLAQADAVVGTRDQVRKTATANFATAKADLAKKTNGSTAAAKAVSDAQAAVSTLSASLESSRAELKLIREQQVTATDGLIRHFAKRGHLRELSAISPEQLASSMLTATDYIERLRASAETRADKRLEKLESDHQAAVAKAKKAGKPKPKKTPPPERASVVSEEFAKSFNAVMKRFVDLYGGEPGQPQSTFFATADQSLFTANGNELRGWLNPSGENLTARLLAEEDVAKLTDDLYTSVLSRRPTSTEVADVERYLTERTNHKREAVQELAWGLLTSVEFRFQH